MTTNINPGYAIFNPNSSPPTEPRTVICVGVGRSGTSAVSSILQFLGLFIGDKITDKSGEDAKLAAAFTRGPEFAEKLINNYNKRYQVWGYKRPGLRTNIKESIKLFRNPMLIVCHRNPLGIAIRNAMARDEACDFTKILKAQRSATDLIESVSKIPCPQLHIGFTAISNSPDDVMKAIAEFINVAIPDGNFTDHMTSQHSNYLAV